MRHSIYAVLVCGFSVLPGLPAVAQSTSNPAMTAPDQVAWQLFIQANTRAGGSNATFVFPSSGNHAWPYWGQQLGAMKPELIATLNG